MTRIKDIFQQYQIALVIDVNDAHSIHVGSVEGLEEALQNHPKLFHGFKMQLVVPFAEGNDYVHLKWYMGRLLICGETDVALVLYEKVTHVLKYLANVFVKALIPTEENRPNFELEDRIQYSSANGLFTNVVGARYTVGAPQHKGVINGVWVIDYLIQTPVLKINRFERSFSPYTITVTYTPYGTDLKIDTSSEQIQELRDLGVVVEYFGKVTLKDI